MKNRFISTIQFFIGWPLSLIALFFIGKVIYPKTSIIATQITSLNIPLLLCGIICFVVYFFLRSYFWKKMLSTKGHTLSLKETAYIWGLSEIKRFVPGNIWAYVGRMSHFGEKGVGKKHIFTFSLFETVVITISCAILSLLSLDFIIYGVLSISSFQLVLKIAAYAFTILCTFFLLRTNFERNFLFLGLTVASFLLFGLGTYFTIGSIVPLYLPDFLTFVGFFVFSYIIGYASFVTPMGIGVREAVIAAGLSKYISSVPLAGVCALFARVVLILSELVFLGITVTWYKAKGLLVNRVESFCIKYKFEIFLCLGIALYAVYFCTASFLRYTNFFTGRFDLGNMDQTVWNTAHGRIFEFTNPDGTNIISRLSFHADFLLVLLAPFYFLWQDPRTLLLIQTVVIAFGAFFVFKIAQYVLRNKALALTFAFIYLLNPSLEHANLYDFHAVTLATTFLLGAWYFLQKTKYAPMVLFLVLAAFTKEQVWFVSSLFGLYLFFCKGKKILGAGIFAFCLGAFYFIFFKAIPAAHGGNHFALSYYSDFGASPVDILKTILLSPQKTLTALFTTDKMLYLVQILSPLGFLALLAPIFLLGAVPDLMINLLSSNAQFHQIYYQYTAVITPFLFIAAIFGAKKIFTKYPTIKIKYVISFLLISAVFSAYLYGPLPGERRANIDMFTKQLLYAHDIDEFLLDIPTRYSIAATNNVGSHLSHRQKIFTIPTGIDQADVVVFLLNDHFAQPSLAMQKQMAEKLTHDPLYIELFREQDFVAFAKKSINFKKRQRKVNPYLPFVQGIFRSR